MTHTLTSIDKLGALIEVRVLLVLGKGDGRVHDGPGPVKVVLSCALQRRHGQLLLLHFKVKQGLLVCRPDQLVACVGARI